MSDQCLLQEWWFFKFLAKVDDQYLPYMYLLYASLI
jgi:hypothetical protein